MSNGSTGLSVSRVHLLQRGFGKEKSVKIVKAPLEKETSGRKCDKLLRAHDEPTVLFGDGPKCIAVEHRHEIQSFR
jgi:hypothetical protein